ncbi:hypothetical protein ACFOMD_15705 [Sphingoaurantiacus capsulatus]|uniref:Uncharacterized protein n=1 Tax=Sphingoaurantiacus capsulatus TaxID=1771310 RepID=A0ABV7XFE5_9SPHN
MAPRPDRVALIVGIAGLALTALSAASLTAAILALPGEATLEAVRSREAVRRDDVLSAANGSRRAANWFERCRHDTNAALALTTTGADPREIKPLVERTLARCPTSPFNWLRLALLRAGEGDGGGARAAWRMSVLTGAHEPRLNAQQLAVGVSLHVPGDREHEDLLAQQVRAVARVDVMGLVAVARQTGAVPFVRYILRGDPALDDFDRAVAG